MSRLRLRFLAVVLVIFTVSACSRAEPGGERGSDTASMMAAAMHQLLTEDHTFGEESPFRIFLLEDRTFDIASMPWFEKVHPAPTPARPVSVDERRAVENALDGIGEVRWVEDIMDWYDGVMPTLDGSVLVQIGGPIIDGDTGFVPVSLLCGNVCGTWFTYRLKRTADGWNVDGIEGSVAIS